MPVSTPLPFSHTTLQQARVALSLRLLDPALVYWSVTQLNSFLVAAIRTTQALTSFYREYDSFTSSQSVPFYDLTTIPFTGAGTDNIFGYSVTDRDLITDIQGKLLEPVGVPWAGSTQFTLDQITQAIQARINQFLLDTGIVVSWPIFPNVTAGVGRVPLPDLTLAVRRAAFVDSTSTPKTQSTLWRQDEFGALSFQRGWPQSPTTPPTSYSLASSPPDTLQLIPIPSNSGQLNLLTVQSGPNLSPATGASLLMVPDDLSQYVMWGALGDLLSADGQSRDFLRAGYCKQRYAEGVQVADIFPSVLTGSVNGNLIPVGSVAELDAFMPNWANTTGVPSQIGMAGRNIVGLATLPDTGPYSIGMDLVRNIPIPLIDADFIQIPRDMVDPLLDYAQHLACFQMGGQEFANTLPMYQAFLKACNRMNSRLNALAFYHTALEQGAMKQAAAVPLNLQSANQ